MNTLHRAAALLTAGHTLREAAHALGIPYSTLRGRLLSSGLWHPVQRGAALTAREQRIMDLTALGLTDRAIGETLGSSAESVRVLRYYARKKLGVPHLPRKRKPAPRRNMYVALRAQGLTNQEIAERFGLRVSSVQSAVSKARRSTPPAATAPPPPPPGTPAPTSRP